MTSPLITKLSARGVMVPMRRPPIAASGRIDGAPLVLVDLHTDDGVVGRAYLFAFTRAMLAPTVATLDALAEIALGQSAAPLALERVLRQRVTLQDSQGLLGQALAACDMAAWDAHAQAAGMPLARLLGATTDSVPAYNSCGLWIAEPDTLGEEAEALIDEGGYDAVKLRLGRADFAADLRAVRKVRAALPDPVRVMSDFNQALRAHEALMRCRALDDEGLYWFEEPIRHDDWRNAARLRAQLRTPVQLGENLRGAGEMDKAIAAGAASLYMPDVQRIGGVSGWLRAATLAAVHDLPLSSHLFPEISAHLLAASPTAHYLEYVDWAAPVLCEPLGIRDGRALIRDTPGCGLTWDEDAVTRYRVC